jgi:hypothetical protein
MQMDEADVDRFEGMAHRLELSKVWAELGSMNTPGFMVLPTRFMGGIWRALPLVRQRGQEQTCSRLAANLLHATTGRSGREYTTREVRNAQHQALLMLGVFCPRVTA